MAREKLTGWFRDAVEMRPQTLGFILPHMALTFIQPDHAEALRSSCHGMAARALTALKTQNELRDDDQIVMFGSERNDMIFHTIVTRKDGEVLYDLLSSVPGHRYNPANASYVSDGFVGGEAKEKFRISAKDFIENFASRVIVPVAAPRHEKI